MTQTTQHPEIEDAIVVLAENGEVIHRFCTEARAKELTEAAKRDGTSISAFMLNGGDASFWYEITTVRDRVDMAKQKLRRDIHRTKVLAKHGVPMDPKLIQSIFRALDELGL